MYTLYLGKYLTHLSISPTYCNINENGELPLSVINPTIFDLVIPKGAILGHINQLQLEPLHRGLDKHMDVNCINMRNELFEDHLIHNGVSTITCY